MKKIILTFALLIYSMSNIIAQTSIIQVGSGVTVMDAPSGTYIKDINNTFAPFIGTWKYENGNEILIVKFEKVTQYYYPEYGNYKDFIKDVNAVQQLDVMDKDRPYLNATAKDILTQIAEDPRGFFGAGNTQKLAEINAQDRKSVV